MSSTMNLHFIIVQLMGKRKCRGDGLQPWRHRAPYGTVPILTPVTQGAPERAWRSGATLPPTADSLKCPSVADRWDGEE